MTDIPLLERLRLGHTTSGMKMLGEAADAIEALEVELSNVSEWAAARAVVLEQLAEANTRIVELEAALELARKLYNSVNGSLDAFEHDLRMDIGNTNYNCIKERLHEFEAARKALGEK
jgi:hypothetical protein